MYIHGKMSHPPQTKCLNQAVDFGTMGFHTVPRKPEFLAVGRGILCILFISARHSPLVAGEVTLFWTSDE